MSEHTALVEATVSTDQIDLIKRTVAKDATDDELRLYLFDCQRRGVHPLDKLIHFTKRAGRYTPITSIDFMRSRAAMTGAYAGNDDAVFTFDATLLVAATVTVYRLVGGIRCPFTGTARWAEYYPGDQSGAMWKKMPHTMLGKCAEALALRKGFPEELAGLYSKEEMDQAGMEPAEQRTIKPPQAKKATVIREPAIAEPSPEDHAISEEAPDEVPFEVHPKKKADGVISEAQRKRLYAIWKQAGWKDEEFKSMLKEFYKIESTTEIPKALYDEICRVAETGKPGTNK